MPSAETSDKWNNSRIRWLTSLAGLIALISVSFPAAAQERVEGQVINGTTNRPVANQLVQLLAVGAGMREVNAIKTDTAGRFVLTSGGGTSGPFFLVQTVYEGVNYRARVEERGMTKLTVYEATGAAPPLHIRSARIVVQAEGATAHVQEFFAIENLAQPPRTFANSDGTFRFHLGESARDPQGAVVGMMNMPIPVAIQDGESTGDFLVNHAIEPGLTVVMVNYDADYAAESLALNDRVDYPIARAELLVSPNSLLIESPLFKAAGIDPNTGMQKFEAADVPSRTALAAQISGEAVAVPQQERPGVEGEIQTTPNSMTRLGVLLLISLLLVLLWALGVRVAKEWTKSQVQKPESPAQKELESKIDALLNSMADLDELRESGKIAEKAYWKERLELKAKVVAILKKSPPSLLESYATRHVPH